VHLIVNYIRHIFAGLWGDSMTHGVSSCSVMGIGELCPSVGSWAKTSYEAEAFFEL